MAVAPSSTRFVCMSLAASLYLLFTTLDRYRRLVVRFPATPAQVKQVITRKNEAHFIASCHDALLSVIVQVYPVNIKPTSNDFHRVRIKKRFIT